MLDSDAVAVVVQPPLRLPRRPRKYSGHARPPGRKATRDDDRQACPPRKCSETATAAAASTCAAAWCATLLPVRGLPPSRLSVVPFLHQSASPPPSFLLSRKFFPTLISPLRDNQTRFVSRAVFPIVAALPNTGHTTACCLMSSPGTLLAVGGWQVAMAAPPASGVSSDRRTGGSCRSPATRGADGRCPPLPHPLSPLPSRLLFSVTPVEQDRHYGTLAACCWRRPDPCGGTCRNADLVWRAG